MADDPKQPQQPQPPPAPGAFVTEATDVTTLVPGALPGGPDVPRAAHHFDALVPAGDAPPDPDATYAPGWVPVAIETKDIHGNVVKVPGHRPGFVPQPKGGQGP